MKLIVQFLDATGNEVTPGLTVEHPDEAIAYANARAFRNGVSQRLGMRVYARITEVG